MVLTMRYGILLLSLLLFAPSLSAAEFDEFIDYDTGVHQSTHGWYLSSQSGGAKQFDVWQIESGYQYHLGANIQLYLSSRLTSSSKQQQASHGLLSGIKYHLSPRISINSALTSTSIEQQTQLGMELSSQYQLTEQLNLNATVDYQDIEQVVALGLGFRF
ncbi:TPA: hypothetical protein ACX6R4_002856 [Photobacterium damselae]|uniref:hypothetical protein n=2 Tax=Photobacterium damselae TaxID=38293 RepID=UPI001EDE1A68|nr:hypothetical protein [Photobacterium damselae]